MVGTMAVKGTRVRRKRESDHVGEAVIHPSWTFGQFSALLVLCLTADE